MVGRMNLCSVVACNNHGMARKKKSHLCSIGPCCVVQESRDSFKYNNSSDRPHACEPVDRRKFRRMQKHSKTLIIFIASRSDNNHRES